MITVAIVSGIVIAIIAISASAAVNVVKPMFGALPFTDDDDDRNKETNVDENLVLKALFFSDW